MVCGRGSWLYVGDGRCRGRLDVRDSGLVVGRGGDRLVVDWGEIFFKKIVSQFYHVYTEIDSPVLAGAGAGAWCLTAWLIRLGEGAGTGAGKKTELKDGKQTRVQAPKSILQIVYAYTTNSKLLCRRTYG